MMADRRATNIKGKNQYADFKKGLRLTRKQDCCGGSCPLYQFYPYKAKTGVSGVEN